MTVFWPVGNSGILIGVCMVGCCHNVFLGIGSLHLEMVMS